MDVGENEEMAMGAEVLARGRGIRITPAQRMEITHLRKMNLPLKRIARKLRIHVQTVKFWIDRYREELNVNETGRPRKTDEEEDFLLCCSGGFF
jgi:transposase